MNPLLRTAAIVSFLGFSTSLLAQEGEKPKPQDPPKAGKKTDTKDDPATAKDPAVQQVDAFIAEKNFDRKNEAWKTKLTQPPKLNFDPQSDYLWHLDTEVGPVVIRYFPDTAPIHVSSGLFLARLGFYDGLGFHRIIPGFMAQGGDPIGNGSGGPGYKFAGELQGGRKHDKPGVLSMAHAGPNTDGSQFFITFAPQPGLDAGYTVWGEVVDGMDTLKPLAAKGTHDNDGRLDKAVKINRTWITVVPKKGADKDKDKAAEPAKASKDPGGAGK